jgi:hypothetical protein
MDYTAQYQPMRSEGQSDPSRSGFTSEDAAWDYVYTQMCTGCRDERRIALLGKDSEEYKAYTDAGRWEPSEYPACSCEWMVLPTDKIDAPYEERMLAAGWKPVEFLDVLKDLDEEN